MQVVLPSARVTPGLIAFADQLHRRVGPVHHVASPLGAWMMLAVGGLALEPAERAPLEEALGMPVGEAADYVRRLLERPSPAVAAAMALWANPEGEGPALERWRARLPNGIASGPMPSLVRAASWLQEVTRGQVQRWPVPQWLEEPLILLSVLSTSTRWRTPYALMPAEALRVTSSSEGRMVGNDVSSVLHAALGTGGRIVRTAACGDVAVHTRDTEDRTSLVSVIAAPEVPAGDVMRAALEIAVGEATHPLPAVSLFDLPLGEGPAWSITEREASGNDQSPELVDALLPAWDARGQHDLLRLAPGFAPLAERLAAPDSVALQARAHQLVEARYTRTGFEALAFGGFAFSRSLGAAPKRIRRATLRFGHPYACVAVLLDGPGEGMTPGGYLRSPWRALPVFSAWVATATDASDGPSGRRWR